MPGRLQKHKFEWVKISWTCIRSNIYLYSCLRCINYLLWFKEVVWTDWSRALPSLSLISECANIRLFLTKKSHLSNIQVAAFGYSNLKSSKIWNNAWKQFRPFYRTPLQENFILKMYIPTQIQTYGLAQASPASTCLQKFLPHQKKVSWTGEELLISTSE